MKILFMIPNLDGGGAEKVLVNLCNALMEQTKTEMKIDVLLLFDEGINKIPPKVAALYYAADRLYNIDKINELLDQGINVILDRYVESNMAYQASKLETVSERINLILWLEQLEFTLLDLPRPDKVVFLYLPYEYRHDQNESNEHLKSAENVYQLLAERYNFDVIYCVNKDKIKTIDEINEEMYQIVKDYLAN